MAPVRIASCHCHPGRGKDLFIILFIFNLHPLNSLPLFFFLLFAGEAWQSIPAAKHERFVCLFLFVFQCAVPFLLILSPLLFSLISTDKIPPDKWRKGNGANGRGKRFVNVDSKVWYFHYQQHQFPLLLCLLIPGFNTFYSSLTFGRRYPGETSTAATGMFYLYNSI